MSDFFRNSVKMLFLFIIFLMFVVFLVVGALGFGNIGYNSNYITFFLYLLYFAGIFSLFFAFWLVFSPKAVGDWTFGLLAFVLFLMLLYYHYLSIYYALTSIDNFKYLLIFGEVLLLYILMSITTVLSVGLQNDGVLDQNLDLEVFSARFRFLLTFFLLSLFSLYVYEAFGDYSQINLIKADFSIEKFPYTALLYALLNSGLLPLMLTIWFIYSPLVKGNVYYYITLGFILIFIYCLQVFFVVFYFHSYPDNKLGYWLLGAIVLVMVYIGATISVLFGENPVGEQVKEKAIENIEDLIES